MLSGHLIGEMFFMHQTGGDPGGDTVLAWELFDIPTEELEEIVGESKVWALLPTAAHTNRAQISGRKRSDRHTDGWRFHVISAIHTFIK